MNANDPEGYGREKNRVRITANLVQVFPEKHLWAESYERDIRSILDLESEVARTIADQINISVTPEERRRIELWRPVDPEAHELYLKGAFFNDKWTKEGFERAIEYFSRALEKDPSNARTYAGLAIAYGGLGIYGDISAVSPQYRELCAGCNSDRGSSCATVLPEIRLVILFSTLCACTWTGVSSA